MYIGFCAFSRFQSPKYWFNTLTHFFKEPFPESFRARWGDEFRLTMGHGAGLLLVPLMGFFPSSHSIPVTTVVLERIGDVMEADVEQEVQQAQEPPQLTGRIQLEHVSFKYDGNSPIVLKDITV